jgi:hypothetical protein
MSEVTIFIIGSIIFAITIYGSVVGGGIALGRVDDAETDAGADDGLGEGADIESTRSVESRR